ncbi:PEPxxWA-CTERM sorting domain-containing protein [Sandarakinorhabdus sp.]|uniref:PEPxxWA-CTERM sorting domain-containing protein n=1 Tax=Sandarakinorhabdus sp. TaxID=1916663 RepID=UPI003F702101
MNMRHLLPLALGLAALASPALAATTHTLNLTGALDDAEVFSFDFGQDTLTFSSVELTGFTPFTLNSGDEIIFNVSFTGFFRGIAPFDGFVIDAATEGGFGQLFGINFFRIDDEPPVNASNGGGSATLIGATGDTTGVNLNGGCGNCLSPIFGRSPGPFDGFMFTGISGNTFVTLDGSYTVDRISLSSQVQTGFEPGAVPEPASWAMMIAGFGLVGAMQRRRQRVVAA